MASVVITRASASKQIPKFIVDVLTNNITDPTTRSDRWIFKDTPKIEFNSSSFPYIIVSEGSLDYTNLSLTGSRGRLGDMSLNITVFHDNPKERDEICDEIRMYLSDPSSQDVDGTSLLANQVKIKSINTSSNDTYTDYPQIMRIKDMVIVLNYWGI